MMPFEQFLNDTCARVADAWFAQASQNAGRGLYTPYYLYYKRAQGPQNGDLILAVENPGLGWELASPTTFEGSLTRDQVFFRVMQVANNLPILGYAGPSTTTPIPAPVVGSAKQADEGTEEDQIEALKSAVHAYWDDHAKWVTQYNLENEDAAEVLYYKDFLGQMSVSDVVTAAEDLGLTLTNDQAQALREEIIAWGGEKFTKLERAGIYKLNGELVGYEVGEVEEQIGEDDEWKAIEAQFGADFVKAHFAECESSYRGDMTISGDYGYVNLSYERWVLTLNVEEVQADFIGSEDDPGGEA